MIGDKVTLGGDWSGRVVCVIDDDRYTAPESKEKWGYLEKGIVVSSPQAGYVHFPEPDDDLDLIERC